jgi:apolipoprotein N-acyltransferase
VWKWGIVQAENDRRDRRIKFGAYALASFLIVAFGTPALVDWLCPVAAIGGYALFWRALLLVEKRKHRFWISTVWYGSVQAVQLSWLTSLTPEYWGGYILAAFALLSLWLGVQFGALSIFVPNGENLTFKRMLALAGAWTLIEWGRLHFLCGFSWNPTGMTLAGYVPSMQLAAIWGVLGLSFAVIFTNLCVLKVFFVRRTWATAAVVAAIPYLFGIAHMACHTRELSHHGKSFEVALVQTGLLVSEKTPVKGLLNAFVAPLSQWKSIIQSLKNQDHKQLDLIVLPEASVAFGCDVPLYRYNDVHALIVQELGEDGVAQMPPKIEGKVSNGFLAQTMANYFGAEVVAGFDAWDVETKKMYNAAFHFTPYSLKPDRYEKRVLLPVAEYIPFSWCSPIAKQFGLTSFFSPGTEAKVFHHTIPFSVSICYEETFSELIREGRQKGASLLVNVTNDNWYPGSTLPEQHYAHGRLRAVENGAPLIRACNTGITAVVDSLGKELARLHDPNTAAVLQAPIQLYHHSTLFTFWGNLGILLPSIAFVLAPTLKKRKKIT